MEWTVELKNGIKYGPFNLLAAPALVRRGIIDANATLFNKSTGKELSVRSLLKSAEGAQPPQAAPATKPAVRVTAPPPLPSPKPVPTSMPVPPAKPAAPPAAKPVAVNPVLVEALPLPPAPLSQVTAATVEGKWQERYQEERKTRLQKEAELSQFMSELSQRHQTASEELATATKELEAAKQAYDRLKEESRAREQGFQKQIQQLAKSVASPDEAGRLAKELAEAKALHSDVKTRATIKEEELAKLVANLSDAATAREHELDNLKKKLAEQIAKASQRFDAEKAEHARTREALDQKTREQTAIADREKLRAEAALTPERPELESKTDDLVKQLTEARKALAEMAPQVEAEKKRSARRLNRRPSGRSSLRRALRTWRRWRLRRLRP